MVLFGYARVETLLILTDAVNIEALLSLIDVSYRHILWVDCVRNDADRILLEDIISVLGEFFASGGFW